MLCGRKEESESIELVEVFCFLSLPLSSLSLATVARCAMERIPLALVPAKGARQRSHLCAALATVLAVIEIVCRGLNLSQGRILVEYDARALEVHRVSRPRRRHHVVCRQRARGKGRAEEKKSGEEGQLQGGNSNFPALFLAALFPLLCSRSLSLFPLAAAG